MAAEIVHLPPETKSHSTNETDDEVANREGTELSYTGVSGSTEESDTDVSTTDDETSDSEDNGIAPVCIEFSPAVNEDWDTIGYTKTFTGAGNLEWSMTVIKNRSSGHEALGVRVQCHNVSHQWLADSHIEFSIIRRCGKKEISWVDHNFTWKENVVKKDLYSWKKLIKHDNGFVDDKGNLNIEIKIHFCCIDGVILPNTYDFFLPSKYDDAILVVRGRKLHVNKAILALASPVFDQLFEGDPRESSSDRQEYVIKKVSCKKFLVFLAHVHAPNTPITEATVDSLLSLAHRFATTAITEKAEQFLLGSEDFSLEEKLLMADVYSLVNLQSWCLTELDSMEKVKAISHTAEYGVVSDKMKADLFEHLMMKSDGTQPKESIPPPSYIPNLRTASEISTREIPLNIDLAKASFPAAGGNVTVKIVSTAESKLAFKVKTSHNQIYRVKPVYGFIEPKADVPLEIMRMAGPPMNGKLVVQWAEVPTEETDPNAPFAAGAQQGEVILPLKAV